MQNQAKKLLKGDFKVFWLMVNTHTELGVPVVCVVGGGDKLAPHYTKICFLNFVEL